MKKNVLTFALLFVTLCSFAQTAVNKDGTLKFKGNVAIIVNSRYYTFQNGKVIKAVDDEIAKTMKTVLRTLVMEKFQNLGFGIVNRDDEASRQVEELIEENKLEDYLDGISVKAKNQGADYLFIVEHVQYSENDAATQTEISTRLIFVENNLGYHSFFRSEARGLVNNEDKMRAKIKEDVKAISNYLEQSLMNIFPEQYFIAKADGKTWNLGVYQTNGMIMPTDKFYAFDFKKENMQIENKTVPIQVIEQVAICQNPKASSGGYLQVKSNKQLSNTSNIVLFRNVSQPVFQGTNQMTITFFGLNADNNSYDGLVKNRINNAVFAGITRHPGFQLIEHDHLPTLKKERELQKGEDFIDGHVVEQMKAIGAKYLLKLENYTRNGGQVSFKMSFISVEQNMIIRTIDVVTSIDNIENEMYKQLCERISYPCVIRTMGKGELEISSTISLLNGTNCILHMTKAIQNPMTGETSYNEADVCTVTVEKYMGNKCIVSVEDVLSAEDMKKLDEYSDAGMVTIQIDGSKMKSDFDIQTDVQQKAEKQEKRQKTKETLRGIGKALLNGVKVNVEVNE